MDIIIEKSVKQFKQILWVGDDADHLIEFLNNSKPGRHTEIKEKLSPGYDIIKDVKINCDLPVWNSKAKAIIDISETPEYIMEQKENDKAKLIEDEKINILDLQAETNLKEKGLLNEAGEID